MNNYRYEKRVKYVIADTKKLHASLYNQSVANTGKNFGGGF